MSDEWNSFGNVPEDDSGWLTPVITVKKEDRNNWDPQIDTSKPWQFAGALIGLGLDGNDDPCVSVCFTVESHYWQGSWNRKGQTFARVEVNMDVSQPAFPECQREYRRGRKLRGTCLLDDVFPGSNQIATQNAFYRAGFRMGRRYYISEISKYSSVGRQRNAASEPELNLDASDYDHLVLLGQAIGYRNVSVINMDSTYSIFARKESLNDF